MNTKRQSESQNSKFNKQNAKSVKADDQKQQESNVHDISSKKPKED
jgi:hypothetical protein